MKSVLRILLAAGALLVFVFAGNAFESSAHQPAAIDALGNPIFAYPPGLVSTAKAVGFLLLAGWLFGQLASSIGFSKITGYLVLGMCASPHVSAALFGEYAWWIITTDQQRYLMLVNDLAIALIALTAGGKIKISHVRETFRAVSLILLFEFTLVLVAIGVLMSFLLSRSPVFEEYGGMTTIILVALVIAVVATANSPAVVIAVLAETKAKGPMADTSLAVTVCKDLLLIIVFAITLALAATAAESGVAQNAAESAAQASSAGVDSIWMKLTKQLGGSLLAGLVVGSMLAWYLRRIKAHLLIVLTLGSFAIALIAEQLGLKTLIVGLVAGLLISNRYNEEKDSLFESIEDLSVPVYVLFFAVAGSKINPSLLAEVWMYVVALVVLRTVAIWSGTAMGCKLSGFEPPASKGIWTAFIPQAGISLALATIVAAQFESFAFAEKVYAILLSAIAIHELIGPVLFKFALERAGEAHTEPEVR